MATSIEFNASELSSSYRSDIIVRRWFAAYIDLTVPLLVIVIAGIAVPAGTLDPILVLVSAHGVAFVYHAFLEGRYGVTMGKWLSGIRVVGLNGDTPGFRRGALRTLLRLIEVNPLFLGGIPAGLVADFSKRRQRLGDMCAQTLVLKYGDLKDAFPEAGPARIWGPRSNFLEWGIRR